MTRFPISLDITPPLSTSGIGPEGSRKSVSSTAPEGTMGTIK